MIYNRSKAISMSTTTFSKHSPHRLGFNECAIASDKVVSARKEARSAHVEMSKMEVREERGQGRTVPKRRRPPITPRGDVCLGLFLYPARAWAFPSPRVHLSHSSVVYSL